MNGANDVELQVLLVEDDRENLDLLMESLPKSLERHALSWDPCDDFDEAINRIANRRYDLIVTDVYRDRKRTGEPKSLVANERAPEIVQRIRDRRFCPIVLFSDGSRPADIILGPFVKFADKSGGNEEIQRKIVEILQTGIPRIARSLHDELDRSAGSYLWGFLEDNWDAMMASRSFQPRLLERLIRRRAAIQIGRLDSQYREQAVVEGVEFYIYPPISGDDLRLGEILQKEKSYWVTLTPHCHLVKQAGSNRPRADFVLTTRTVSASSIVSSTPIKGSQENRLDELRRRIGSPAQVGKPEGRYWFLPGFLDMPDQYCDFLQIESIPCSDLATFSRFAVLDTPFAEGLQASFTRFYSAVGVPSLDSSRFTHLLPE